MSEIKIYGVLAAPDGTLLPAATLEFIPLETTEYILKKNSVEITTDNSGNYSVTLLPGKYRVRMRTRNKTVFTVVGEIYLEENSPDGTLNDYLRFADAEISNPTVYAEIKQMYRQTRAAAEKTESVEQTAAQVAEHVNDIQQLADAAAQASQQTQQHATTAQAATQEALAAERAAAEQAALAASQRAAAEQAAAGASAAATLEIEKLDNAGALMTTIRQFGAVGDGRDESAVFLAADAHSIKTGETIRVNAGEYTVKNLELGGSWSFDDGASISGKLNATDNIIVARNGLRLNNATIKKYLLETPPDGDYGNAIKIGAGRQPPGGTGTADIILRNITIYNSGARRSQSVEMLGDVSNVLIDSMTIYGTGAVIVHWGGDMGEDGHSSDITYSYHPHDITIRNLKFLKNQDGHGTDNGLILSACYNINADVYSDSAVRTLLLFPGDVYDAVAVDRDVGKICTGINVRAVANSPVGSSVPAIHVSGIPATPRTVIPAKYGIDDDASMDFIVDASINCGSQIYERPLVIIEGVSNLRARINKTGSAVSPGRWAHVQYSTRCDIQLTGVSEQGALIRGVMCSALTINGSRPKTQVRSEGERGCSIETYNSVAFALDGVVLSDNVITVTPTDSNGIFSGMYLLCDGEPVARVTKSTLCSAGVTVDIPVTNIYSDIPAGASVVFAMPCEGTTVRGSMENFLVNYHVGNAWGVKFDVTCINAARTGINFVGDYVRGVVINGTFTGTGHENSTPARADIAAVASLQIRGLEISASFDAKMINPYIENRFRYTGTDHSGICIHNCSGTPTVQNISFSILHSEIDDTGNQPQIYANKLDDNQTPLEIKTGQYMGQIFFGNSRNNQPPATGYWTSGSRLYNSDVSDCAGYICVEPGAPGVWKPIVA